MFPFRLALAAYTPLTKDLSQSRHILDGDQTSPLEYLIDSRA